MGVLGTILYCQSVMTVIWTELVCHVSRMATDETGVTSLTATATEPVVFK
jgi:hypothetical protein